MRPAERAAVEREVRRVVEGSPFELFDLRIGQDRSLHVFLDRRDGRLSVDDAARFHRALRAELAGQGVDVDAWTIDVESPGARRPLRTRRHFETSIGQRVRVVRRDPLADVRVVTGILREVGETTFGVEPDGGGPPVAVAFGDVSEARLDPRLPF